MRLIYFSNYVPFFSHTVTADTNITQVPVSFFIYKDARLFQTSETSTSDDPDVAREGIFSQVIAATLEVDIEVKDLPRESAVITRFQLQEVHLMI